MTSSQLSKGRPSRVIVAVRHQNMLEGIRSLLESVFDVVLMVADETSLMDSLETCQPDLVVVDLSLPLAEEKNVLMQLRRTFPELKVIILSVHDEQTAVDTCLDAGAKGFVLTRCVVNDLVPAVINVQKDRTFVSPAIQIEV